MHRSRTAFVVGMAGLVSLTWVTAAPLSATAQPLPAVTPSCASLSVPVLQVVKPGNGASLLTPWSGEAAGAAKYGFTEKHGTAFYASLTAKPGLKVAYRLYKASANDFLITTSTGEVGSAQKNHGYKLVGPSFYAAAQASSCAQAVQRYRKGNKHRLTMVAADQAALQAAGWVSEGVGFYAASATPVTAPAPVPTPPAPTPPPAPAPQPQPDPEPPVGTSDKGSFTFAVMPDTQQEVLRPKDTRFVNRTTWLVKQRSALNLKFVTHTGDVHNWDTPNHDQYAMSSKAMKVLEDAKIPYSLAIGNHDTEATGVGGGARDAKKTRVLQRDTTTFNSYYNAARYGGVSGAFEKNKVDNVYSIYSAGGEKWMVLVLELWPRQSVVDWAKTVVASHPDSNVIIATHDYLSDGGGIEQSGGYGNLSPQALYDQLVKQYANVRMVVSGHVGYAASRIDTGVHGNKIYSFMTTIHSVHTNPTRMFTIDTKAGTLKTWIYCPYSNETYTQYSQTLTGVKFVS